MGKGFKPLKYTNMEKLFGEISLSLVYSNTNSTMQPKTNGQRVCKGQALGSKMQDSTRTA